VCGGAVVGGPGAVVPGWVEDVEEVEEVEDVEDVEDVLVDDVLLGVGLEDDVVASATEDASATDDEGAGAAVSVRFAGATGAVIMPSG
jgi:hypothetical protein